MNLDPIAKLMIFLGAGLILIGVAWQFGWIQTLRLGRLPGDVVIERHNFRFYLPLTSSILMSILISALLWAVRYLGSHWFK